MLTLYSRHFQWTALKLYSEKIQILIQTGVQIGPIFVICPSVQFKGVFLILFQIQFCQFRNSQVCLPNTLNLDLDLGLRLGSCDEISLKTGELNFYWLKTLSIITLTKYSGQIFKRVVRCPRRPSFCSYHHNQLSRSTNGQTTGCLLNVNFRLYIITAINTPKQ